MEKVERQLGEREPFFIFDKEHTLAPFCTRTVLLEHSRW